MPPVTRQGDPTLHGGVIAAGMPTVLVENKPVARVSDMHTCPLVSGVVPHVGGPILPPCCITVLAGNLPVARMGDKATCTGPPDSILVGQITVLAG